jgi:hypothetical protein
VVTADEVWAEVTADACTAGATADCLPYNYPEDYCHARAHKVCLRFEARGVSAGKVWIMGDLRVASKYHPDCSVGWAWHVATFVRPEGETDEARFYVFDPTANETGYVSLEDWLGYLGVPNSKYRLTLADSYLGVCDGPGYLEGKCEGPGVTYPETQSDDDIAFAILLLGEKSPQPPYNCP